MLCLIKTDTGSCNSCGSSSLIKCGQAWHCGSCGTYFPVEFPKSSVFTSLRNDIDKLKQLNSQLCGVRKKLEKEFE